MTQAATEIINTNIQGQAEQVNWLRRIGAVAALSVAASVGVQVATQAPAAAVRPYGSVEMVNPNTTQDDLDNSLDIYASNVLGSQMHNGGHAPQRAHNLATIYKGQTDAPEADVVLMQEVQPDQERLFKKELPTFQAITARDPQNMIMVNKETMTVMDKGSFKYSSYGDHGLSNGTTGLWVHAKSKQTGDEVTLINARLPAWNEDPGSDKGGALKREHDAKLIKKLSIRLSSEFKNSVEIIGGDSNSTDDTREKGQPQFRSPKPNKDSALHNNDNRLPYYTYEDAKMGNTFDMVQNKDKHDKRDKTSDVLDWTVDGFSMERSTLPNTTNAVLEWANVTNAAAKRGSDHDPLRIKVRLNKPVPVTTTVAPAPVAKPTTEAVPTPVTTTPIPVVEVTPTPSPEPTEPTPTNP